MIVESVDASSSVAWRQFQTLGRRRGIVYKDVSFAEHHEPIKHLIRTHPACILDVGAGIGTDAAALAAMGHTVVAVEPVDALRVAGSRQLPLPGSTARLAVDRNCQKK